MRLLMTMTGVGYFTAMLVVSEVGDVGSLQRAREGEAPKESAKGSLLVGKGDQFQRVAQSDPFLLDPPHQLR